MGWVSLGAGGVNLVAVGGGVVAWDGSVNLEMEWVGVWYSGEWVVSLEQES